MILSYLVLMVIFGFMMGNFFLMNTTKKGKIQKFNNLVYHGGAGATLEMRSFTRSSLFSDFTKAGFSQINFHQLNVPEFGIKWPINWSLHPLCQTY